MQNSQPIDSPQSYNPIILTRFKNSLIDQVWIKRAKYEQEKETKRSNSPNRGETRSDLGRKRCLRLGTGSIRAHRGRWWFCGRIRRGWWAARGSSPPIGGDPWEEADRRASSLFERIEERGEGERGGRWRLGGKRFSTKLFFRSDAGVVVVALALFYFATALVMGGVEGPSFEALHLGIGGVNYEYALGFIRNYKDGPVLSLADVAASGGAFVSVSTTTNYCVDQVYHEQVY